MPIFDPLLVENLRRDARDGRQRCRLSASRAASGLPGSLMSTRAELMASPMAPPAVGRSRSPAAVKTVTS